MPPKKQIKDKKKLFPAQKKAVWKAPKHWMEKREWTVDSLDSLGTDSEKRDRDTYCPSLERSQQRTAPTRKRIINTDIKKYKQNIG